MDDSKKILTKNVILMKYLRLSLILPADHDDYLSHDRVVSIMIGMIRKVAVMASYL